MENSEHAKEENEEVADPSRRNFLRSLGAVGAAFLCGGIPETFAQDGSAPSRYGKKWFFPPEQMSAMYDREYNGEKILKNCFRKEGEQIVGTFNGKEINIPHRFVDQVLRHLQAMIEAGAARFIFRLDASHGHPFMERALYTRRYGDALLDIAKETEILVTDPDVGILYHNSEHLDPQNKDPLAQSLVQKRNVIGHIVATSLELLPLPKGEGKRTAHNTPEGATDFRAYIKFAAHKDGTFAFKIGDKEIRLDLSLDDDDYY